MQELGEFRSLNLWNRVFVNRCREFSNFLSRSPGHRALGPGDADAQISVLLAIRFDAFGLHQPTTEWARHPLQIKDVFMCRTRPNPWHLFFFSRFSPTLISNVNKHISKNWKIKVVLLKRARFPASSLVHVPSGLARLLRVKRCALARTPLSQAIRTLHLSL